MLISTFKQVVVKINFFLRKMGTITLKSLLILLAIPPLIKWVWLKKVKKVFLFFLISKKKTGRNNAYWQMKKKYFATLHYMYYLIILSSIPN